MTKKRMVNARSAAITANVVHRFLKMNGFLMFYRGASTFTEGFLVEKVGSSCEVGVYYLFNRDNPKSSEAREKDKRIAMERARKYLEDRGFEFNEKGHIVCREP